MYQISIFDLLEEKPTEYNPWVRLTDGQLVYVYKSSIKEYTRTEHDPQVIDHIGKGTVDEKPAIIGLALCVSGLYEEFEELKPFYWKENKYGVINE